MSEKVILVNKFDQNIGEMNKMEAHKKGLLHRAISVFIFNDKGDFLLQRRAQNKYHSPGLWSNTACTHPRLNESPYNAAKRRLEEEMGMKTNINFKFKFIYKALLDRNLIEHELDHVYCGFSNEIPKYNPQEVCDFKFISKKELELSLNENPSIYTEWFKICYKRVIESLKINKQKEQVNAF
jgi:isopentenyl-diphosphate delta-isomerase